MGEEPVDLDRRRGMAAQKETDIRRLVREVADERAALRKRQEELERFMAAAPAITWAEAVEKVRYILSLFAATAEGQDPRRQKLVADLLEDLDRLLSNANDNRPAVASGPTEGDV